MGEGPKRVVCLRRCGRPHRWSGGVEGGDPWRRVDGKCLVNGSLGGSQRGGLDDGAGLAGEGDLLQPAGFAVDPPPTLPASAATPDRRRTGRWPAGAATTSPGRRRRRPPGG